MKQKNRQKLLTVMMSLTFERMSGTFS